MTRRDLIQLLGSSALAQGVSTRNVKPTPRGKPSGLPFHAKFTDIAAEAGLARRQSTAGSIEKTYILETVGCGVAFFDYDNDGWLDILVLSGTRIGRRASRRRPIGCTRTTATAPSPTSPKSRPDSHRMGVRR